MVVRLSETKNQQPRDALVITVTVGVDGRIYCHDLARELVPVLAAVCPDDRELMVRAAAGGQRIGERE